jgi:hypothetical protein
MDMVIVVQYNIEGYDTNLVLASDVSDFPDDIDGDEDGIDDYFDRIDHITDQSSSCKNLAEIMMMVKKI